MQTSGSQIVPRAGAHQVGCVLAGLCSACATLVLSGCQAVVSSPTAARVRIIAASPDSPALDIYLNNTMLVYNLGFGSVTSYISVDAGTHTAAADTSGTRQRLVSAKNTFVSSSQYTVLISNSAANLQQVILKDQMRAAPAGQISLRLVDQAQRIGALDVYLVPPGQNVTAITPSITNLTFSTNTGYLNMPAGTYTLVVLPTGSVPAGATTASYTGTQVTYAGGSATTLILIDQQVVTSPGVQLITTADYTPPTDTP